MTNYQNQTLFQGLVLFTAITLFNVSFASAEKPTACPGAKAVQAGGLLGVIPYLKARFMVYNTSSYDTTGNWVFYMGAINAQSSEQALVIGNKLLKTLTGAPTPEENHGEWFCKFKTANPSIMAVASMSGTPFQNAPVN